MTEQEYEAKQEMLKQVKQNIKDLELTKYNLQKEIDEYEFVDYTGKYLYDTRNQIALKVICQYGRSITCIGLNKYYNEDFNVTEYFVDMQYYLSGEDMRNVREMSAEEFYEYLNDFTEEMKSSIAMR